MKPRLFYSGGWWWCGIRLPNGVWAGYTGMGKTTSEALNDWVTF